MALLQTLFGKHHLALQEDKQTLSMQFNTSIISVAWQIQTSIREKNFGKAGRNVPDQDSTVLQQKIVAGVEVQADRFRCINECKCKETGVRMERYRCRNTWKDTH